MGSNERLPSLLSISFVSGRITVAGGVGFIHWRHTSNGVGVFWTMLDVDMVAMAMIGQQFTLALYKGLEYIFL